ncbi:hypothetical protein C1H46_035559 [Malus baccata]|uniref:Uncharacterized protein n=1 Tax=Malus baccata TaxID=106549 RepID=A0A540KXD9_MALBA|nr:hypothetical protein C1H46_035559 [Malus baccata]
MIETSLPRWVVVVDRLVEIVRLPEVVQRAWVLAVAARDQLPPPLLQQSQRVPLRVQSRSDQRVTRLVRARCQMQFGWKTWSDLGSKCNVSKPSNSLAFQSSLADLSSHDGGVDEGEKRERDDRRVYFNKF